MFKYLNFGAGRCCRRFAGSLLLFFLGMTPASAGYGVKADYLYQFADYVKWNKVSGDIQICVVGPDPFGKTLKNTIKGKRIKGRSLKSKRLDTSASSKNCHILFVSAGLSESAVKNVLQRAKRGTLTVSDKSGFLQQGGMIKFFDDKKGNVRFRINNNAAKKAGVRLSAQLLRLAK